MDTLKEICFTAWKLIQPFQLAILTPNTSIHSPKSTQDKKIG